LNFKYLATNIRAEGLRLLWDLPRSLFRRSQFFVKKLWSRIRRKGEGSNFRLFRKVFKKKEKISKNESFTTSFGKQFIFSFLLILSLTYLDLIYDFLKSHMKFLYVFINNLPTSVIEFVQDFQTLPFINFVYDFLVSLIKWFNTNILMKHPFPHPKSISDLLWLAAYSGMVAGVLSFYKSIKVYHNRFLVFPFTARGHAEQNELDILAALMTNQVASELQDIGKLLLTPQVETAHSLRIESDDLKLIMTGGLDVISSGKINDFNNLELSLENVKIPFGVLTYWFQNLARTKLRGTLHLKDDRTLEIRVEIDRWFNNPDVISKRIDLPGFSTGEYTKKEIEAKSRSIACELVFKLLDPKPYISQVDSFEELLKGLNASCQKKWWLAISHYRRAIEIEESFQKEMGIGHYLLGTALVFLGNYMRGYTHLILAKEHGPQTPEIHYMLGLTLLSLHSHHLHKNEKNLDLPKHGNGFDEILEDAKKAIEIKPGFADAYHLLGMTYYLRGRLKEIEFTYKYESETMDSYPKMYGDYYLDYRESYHFLYKASKFYLKKETEQVGQINQASPPDYLITYHQIADALRGMRLYGEAAWYYQKVLENRPNNLRSVIDWSKTLCLAGKWEKAEKTALKQLFRLPTGEWDADAHFYMGWMYAGKAARLFQYKSKRKEYVFLAMRYLDFSLHQRPSYIATWQQIDWLTPLSKAISKIKNYDEKKEKSISHNEGLLTMDNTLRFDRIKLWLNWRMCNYGFQHNESSKENIRKVFE